MKLSIPLQDDLLLGNNYDEGRHQKPWSGGDWNEYMRGKADQQRGNDTTNTSSGNKGPQIDGGDGKGNNCLGPLILITLGLIIAIQSLLTAIISGAVLYFLNKKFDLLYTDKKYKSEFSICAILIFVYMSCAVVLVVVQKIFYGQILGFRESSVIDTFYKYFLTGELYTYLTIKQLLIFHSVCTCITFLIFKSFFDTVMSPRQGALKLLFVIIGIILPSIVITSP